MRTLQSGTRASKADDAAEHLEIAMHQLEGHVARGRDTVPIDCAAWAAMLRLGVHALRAAARKVA